MLCRTTSHCWTEHQAFTQLSPSHAELDIPRSFLETFTEGLPTFILKLFTLSERNACPLTCLSGGAYFPLPVLLKQYLCCVEPQDL